MVRKILKNLYLLTSAVLVITFGSGIALAMYVGSTKLPLRQYFSSTYTNAIWDWDDPEAQSQQQINSIADFMYLHQLNVLYLNIGSHYESLIATDGQAKDVADRQSLDRALVRYISTLRKYNITVYAAAGDVSWSDQDKQYIPFSILKYVESYNQQHPYARLAGVEFDIESYNQDGFSAGSTTVKSLILNDWLDMVDRLASESTAYTKQAGSPIGLGFAIPYWFDNENSNIPSLTRNYKTGPTLYHLLDRLNTVPKSNVVVMDYRNTAKGNDGIIFHGRTEVEYAQAKAPDVSVILGQEVNDVQPAKVTYYGEAATDLSNQVAITEAEFRNDSAFGGIAINDLAGFQTLSDQ